MVMTDDVGDQLSRPESDVGQQALIERAKQVLGMDDRVLGIWLVGSYGTGTSDQFSDVDLLVVVDPDDVEGLCDDWPGLSDEIAPTVFRRRVGDRPLFNQVTTDWLRFDLSVGTPATLSGSTRSRVKPLLDPRGLSARLGEPGPLRQPDPDRVESISLEFLRVLGLLPVVVGREEFVLAVSGVGLLRDMLIDLMLEDVATEDRGGALHLNPLLPADRQQVLSDLPALRATRESVIDAHVACASAFLPLARDLHNRCGLTWPQEFEDATRHHLTKALSIELAVIPPGREPTAVR